MASNEKNIHIRRIAIVKFEKFRLNFSKLASITELFLTQTNDRNLYSQFQKIHSKSSKFFDSSRLPQIWGEFACR